MLQKNSHQSAVDKAASYFGNGFHCAEAVASAVLEALDHNPTEAAAHSTAFGGGVGSTYEELCGALSGGLIAIGHLYGRRRRDEDWDLAAKKGAELRRIFLDQFETCHCGTLRERFGQEQQMDECRKIVRKITDELLIMIGDKA